MEQLNLTDTERRLALLLALDHYSISDVARHLKVSRGFIQRRLKRSAFSKLVEDLRQQRMARFARTALAVMDANRSMLDELDRLVSSTEERHSVPFCSTQIGGNR